jgi:hypothetical protein
MLKSQNSEFLNEVLFCILKTFRAKTVIFELIHIATRSIVTFLTTRKSILNVNLFKIL